MPKITMSFNLPDESEQLKDAQQGTRAAIVLHEMLMYFRKTLKYEHLQDAEYGAYLRAQKYLVELIQEYEVTIS